MAFDIAEIERLLAEAFPGAQISVRDTRGDQNHFAIEIASPVFSGKSRVAQHQMVYAALRGHAGEAIHALSISTRPL